MRHGGSARCRSELWRVHMQEPAPSVLGDAIERPSILAARVGRVVRRSQGLPAAGTACDRLAAKRRDVRGREPMGIPGHSGAQGGWRYTGHMAARMHRQRGGVHGSSARAGAGPLGVSIDRAKRGQADVGTGHRRMVLNETSGPWPGQRSEPPGGRGGAQRAYSDACGFRDDLGGNPGRDRREPRHCRSCAPGGPRAAKGGGVTNQIRM